MANPVMSEKRFARSLADNAGEFGHDAVMTVEGTVVRGLFLALVLVGAAFWPWSVFFNEYTPGAETAPNMAGFIVAGALAGLVLSLLVSFIPKTAPYLAVPYAFCEGVCLGGLSAQFEASYPGIVIQAAAGTFGVLLVMLSLYAFGIIKATAKLRAVLLGAGGAVFLFYMVAMLLGLFGVRPAFINEMLYGSGLLGLGFNIVVCLVAAFYLILDFDMVETGAAMGAPKYMSWYAAFALLVTLVWLYLEILKLLARSRGRD